MRLNPTLTLLQVSKYASKAKRNYTVTLMRAVAKKHSSVSAKKLEHARGRKTKENWWDRCICVKCSWHKTIFFFLLLYSLQKSLLLRYIYRVLIFTIPKFSLRDPTICARRANLAPARPPALSARFLSQCKRRRDRADRPGNPKNTHHRKRRINRVA